MNIRACFITVFILGFGLVGFSAADEGVGPFDLALGQSTSPDLTERFPSASHAGTSTWTDGPLYRVDGRHLPLDGAKRASFIFGTDDQLEAVIVTLRKRRFDAIRQLLDQQYERVSARIPHVGDSHVKWQTGDVVIELDAPHMSFDMELKYRTERFIRQFESGRRAIQEQERRRQGEQL